MNKNTKKATQKKVVKNKCVSCGTYRASLQINDNKWICQDCAQYANDWYGDK